MRPNGKHLMVRELEVYQNSSRNRPKAAQRTGREK